MYVRICTRTESRCAHCVHGLATDLCSIYRRQNRSLHLRLYFYSLMGNAILDMYNNLFINYWNNMTRFREGKEKEDTRQKFVILLFPFHVNTVSHLSSKMWLPFLRI